MTDRPTVFCKDCKFVRKGWTDPWSTAKCGHPQAIEFDSNYLVHANGTAERSYASSMRGYGRCGPEAKLWEPRK